MSDRFRLILFIILALTLIWFAVILLCLSKSGDQPDQWRQQRRPSQDASLPPAPLPEADRSDRPSPLKTPDFMRFFQSVKPSRRLTTLETIFYEFDPLKSWRPDGHGRHYNATAGVATRSEHEQAALSLNTLNNPTDRQVKSEGYKLFAFNVLLSNRIGLTRPLPDSRPAKCRRDPERLPLAEPGAARQRRLLTSIIICYYNEAPSALLRTIQSIVSRTPASLIQEIIVVDDFSEPSYSLDQMQPYTNKLYAGHQLIRFVRTAKREGLIRARLFGSGLAQGDVLVFLDSHVEANAGWLEPLLEKIQENRSTIACPMIDLINAETMIYSASPMVRGGLTWALHFKWDSVPAADLKTYDDFAKPIRSASMAGGLYAIDREFFQRLGAYDAGMNLWGGENIEMSLRTWMCGGQILILPCSRLGHIFRKKRPYGPAANEPDSLLYNSVRSARVWLDEHVDKFYATNPAARGLDPGDISERLALRQQLKCHNFTWFIDEIYPALKETASQEAGAGPEPELEAEQSRPADGKGRQAKGHLSSYSRRLNRSVREGARGRHLHRLPINEIPLDDAMAIFKGTFQRNENYFNLPISPLLPGARLQPTLFSRPARQAAHWIATFQIQLVNSNLCIESKSRFAGQEFSRLILNECAKQPTANPLAPNTTSAHQSPAARNLSSAAAAGSPPTTLHNQLWSETEWHDYRLGADRCLDIMKNLPLLRRCDGMRSLQAWSHQNQTIGTYISDYSSGNLCLAVERVQRGEPIIITICDKTTGEDDGGDKLEHLASLPLENWVRRRNAATTAHIHHKQLKDPDDDGGSWLTGPLPLLESLSQRRGDRMRPSHRVHQKWNLILAPS